MAAEAKVDDTPLKFEDIIDIDHELKVRANLLNIALSPLDDSWTVHNTKDDAISVVYKQRPNSNVLTVRGAMKMKGVDIVNLHYKYMECGYNDIWDKHKRSDPLVTECKIVKLIDSDHSINYESSDSGFWVIASRDYTVIQTRFKEIDYKMDDLKYNTISADFAYSVPEKLIGDKEDHPMVQPVKNKHVRANIMTFGYVLSELEGAPKGEVEVCYVLEMDPMGMIPTYVVNSFAPGRGMGVKNFVEEWPFVVELMKMREANGFKKDHEPMFDAPHPKLTFIGKKKEEDVDDEEPLKIFKRPKDDKEDENEDDKKEDDDQKEDAAADKE